MKIETLNKISPVQRTYGNDWFDDLNPNAEADKDRHAFIYLDTIGRKYILILI